MHSEIQLAMQFVWCVVWGPAYLISVSLAVVGMFGPLIRRHLSWVHPVVDTDLGRYHISTTNYDTHYI